MNLPELLKRLLPRRADLKQPPVPAGTYPYLREHDGQLTRFHLRVDNNGGGMLLANATKAARLSVSGVLLAKRVLDGAGPERILPEARRQFKGAPRQTLREDLARVKELLDNLAAAPESYPILNPQDPALTDASLVPDMPYCADVRLHSPDVLVPLLDRLWEVGFPHVTLIAPEGADPQAIIRAVERAEDLGMIAGVRARATDLSQLKLLRDLAMAGVDHVNLLYLSREAAVHDAIAGNGDHERVLEAFETLHEREVCAVAEVPLIEQTLDKIESALEELSRRSIVNVGFFAVAAADNMDAASRQGALTSGVLLQTADLIEESAQERSARYLWYPPLGRDPGCALERQILRGPRASGDHAVRIEPDGGVYVARGPWRCSGNVFRDDWAAIEADPAYQNYRRRVCSPTRCDDCPGLAICAADCPRSPEGWAQASPAADEVIG